MALIEDQWTVPSLATIILGGFIPLPGAMPSRLLCAAASCFVGVAEIVDQPPAAAPIQMCDSVFIPPRQYADFIIHYDDTTFQVHKFVLHQHSACFRAYLEAFIPRLTGSEQSSNEAHSCDHAHIAHCIHLPQQTGLVQQIPVTAADLQLFLCHLYFASHYHYPPLLPRADIDLDADPPTTCLTFPDISSLDWALNSTATPHGRDR